MAGYEFSIVLHEYKNEVNFIVQNVNFWAFELATLSSSVLDKWNLGERRLTISQNVTDYRIDHLSRNIQNLLVKRKKE